jgi:hypothetical protein
MSKYIDIDKYDKCGIYTCDDNNKDCKKQLSGKYRFYTEFEHLRVK